LIFFFVFSLESEVSQNVKNVVDQLIKRLVNGNTELEEFGLVRSKI
jgi:hypothetical protein